MKLPRNAKVFRGQLDVVPVMGVLFLLIIFLVLKNFVSFVPGVPIRLPEAGEFSGFRGPAMSIIVNSGGQYFFNNRELREEQVLMEMREAVSRNEQELTLIVQADREVKHDVLMALHAMAREAGIRDVFHAVKPVP